MAKKKEAFLKLEACRFRVNDCGRKEANSKLPEALDKLGNLY